MNLLFHSSLWFTVYTQDDSLKDHFPIDAFLNLHQRRSFFFYWFGKLQGPKPIINFLPLPVLHLCSCRYSGVWLVTRCGSLMNSDYDLHDWNLCLAVLIAYGIVFRIIAFFGMVTFQKK